MYSSEDVKEDRGNEEEEGRKKGGREGGREGGRGRRERENLDYLQLHPLISLNPDET